MTPFVPVDPGPDEARRWLLEELSKAPYQAAQPTWFDRAAQAVGDWLASLRVPDGAAWYDWLPVAGVAAAIVIVAAALIMFGVPRLNRRSRRSQAVLTGDETRTSAELRRSASRAAAAGEWERAFEELFRALARDLVERTVLTQVPGMTAREIAVRASRVFPALAADLRWAADGFDSVRYLGREASRARYERLTELDRGVRSASPVLETVS